MSRNGVFFAEMYKSIPYEILLFIGPRIKYRFADYLGCYESLKHRAPTQSVCVADSYFNVLELPFASPIAIYC